MAAPKGPEPSGPFGENLTSRQIELLKRPIAFLYGALKDSPRAASDWDIGVVESLHLILGFSVLAPHEKHLRSVDEKYHGRLAPQPLAIKQNLYVLVSKAQAVIEHRTAYGMFPANNRISDILESLARFYVECLKLRPFRALNNTWAHMMCDALFIDCGLYPGTHFDLETPEQERRFYDAVEAILTNDEADPLATILLEGWMHMRRLYREREDSAEKYRRRR